MKNGYLIVHVYGDSIANPIGDAMVTVSKSNEIIERKYTDDTGTTGMFVLETVDKSFSEEEQYKVRPYEIYDVTVEALGLTKTKIEGVQIFDGISSIQNVYLTSIDEDEKERVEKIDSNALWGKYPEIISEENSEEEGISPFVLNQVLIPETIIVHDGIPTNTNAANYTVPFIDYIKNVASSEIYSTWPVETIKANVLVNILEVVLEWNHY